MWAGALLPIDLPRHVEASTRRIHVEDGVAEAAGVRLATCEGTGPNRILALGEERALHVAQVLKELFIVAAKIAIVHVLRWRAREAGRGGRGTFHGLTVEQPRVQILILSRYGCQVLNLQQRVMAA